MPAYNDLRPDVEFEEMDFELAFPGGLSPVVKKRTIEYLLALRKGLDEQVSVKKSDRNLLIASWNIKEFGHTKQRLPEAYYYTAEIMSRFDLIVVQEVKSTLKDLHIVMRILGDDWTFIINDITEGSAGNRERSAYIFNKKRVEFAGLAGEIVLWDDLTSGSTIKQLKRTPYITGFKAGWKTFAIICFHLEPGDDSDDVTFRRTEVELLLAALAEKKAKKRLFTENLILAGDFNFYSGATKDDPTVQLITNAGFKEVEGLIGVDTNASETQRYDRLFLTTDDDYFTLAINDLGSENGGVFNPFDFVFKDDDRETYKQQMKDVYGGSRDLDDPDMLAGYFHNYWRKNQMSDHYPIWFELITDSADEFLTERLAAYN